MIRKVARSLG